MSCFYVPPPLILVVPLTRMPVVGGKNKYVSFMKVNEYLLIVSKTQAFETLTIIQPMDHDPKQNTIFPT